MKLKFIFIFLLFFSSASYAGNKEICSKTFSKSAARNYPKQPQTMTEALYNMMENYFVADQYHPYFHKPRNRYQSYIIPNGGLCGPTSANAFLTALNHMHGHFTDSHPSDIIQLVDLLGRVGRTDARDGIDTRPFMSGVSKVARVRNQAIEISNLAVDYGTGTPVAEKFDFSLFEDHDANTVYFLVTEIYAGEARPSKLRYAHFSLAFDFNPRLKTIKIIDPLHTDRVFTAKLVPDIAVFSGKPLLRLFFDKKVPAYPKDYISLLTEVVKVEVTPPRPVNAF